MEDFFEVQLHAIAEIFERPEIVIKSSLELWGKANSSKLDDFANWKKIVESVSGGDNSSINIVKQNLTEDTPNEYSPTMGSGDGKLGYWWGWHTKNKVPICPAQKLWISHKIMSAASDILDLSTLIATATKNPEAGVALATVAIGFFILKKIDKGRGIYIHWQPGPLYPGGPTIPPTEIKGQ